MNTQHVANVIRGLSIDGVQKANSGHPGMPLGTADFATILFLKFLNYDPADPQWPNRDRYVQSAGHGSMLLYSLLHLAGYGLTLDELKQFRQWGSRTPGHPEVHHTPGVETTTGPLGQGCGAAVGMALAEAMLAARFNKGGRSIVDHYTYVLAGDGDLMEGISHEAFSMAGHLGLHKLIVFYDSNRITIEGSTDLAYSDDVRKRFEGYNWNVLEIDGHDHAAIEQALNAARTETKRPTLIIGHTTIGKGSPHKAGTAESHGSPLGPEEVKLTKQALGLPVDKDFWVSDEAQAAFDARRKEGEAKRAQWLADFAAYEKEFPQEAAAWRAGLAGDIPADLEKQLPTFSVEKPLATRAASGTVIQTLAKLIPHFVGGSADLAPSTSTFIKGADSVGPHQYAGKNLHYGIREHAMVAVVAGMTLHGGFTVFGATFLVFSDYCRPALRLSALMETPVINVFTHDSIFLGEDGPTHQAVEHLAALRSIPNMIVLRPADANETAYAWVAALRQRKSPTSLVLTRQAVPVLDRTAVAPAAGVLRGGYTLWESDPMPEILLIATGSEVAIALSAGQRLAKEDGKKVRVVSLPSWEIFEQQSAEYRESVLPKRCTRRLAVEAGVSFGWERYVGSEGRTVTINRFGASAPDKVLAEKFGFTPQHILDAARALFA
ncbi:MAG: transketolase [Kiritimatiellae bacterium]|nr:transketolase [Kiritimatiellia bacterium]MCO5067576.1 transketolase [Kiritimatiellia bacterium]